MDRILEYWCPRIAGLLGDALRGAHLFGSVPLGGFDPLWSDLDVCTLLREPVSDAQADAIGRLHDEMIGRFLRGGEGGWLSSQFFEGPYVPEELAARPGASARCLLVGTDHRAVEECDPVPGFERYMLAHHSVVLFGEPAPFVPDTKAAMVRHQAWLPARLARPAEAHSPIMLAGLLQELARTIVFFRDDRFLSKTAALEEEIAAGSPFADAYRIALHVRRRGSERADEHRGELAALYSESALRARRFVEELIATKPGP